MIVICMWSVVTHDSYFSIGLWKQGELKKKER